MTAMLEVRGLTRRFGGLVAVNDLSFEVHEGEMIGLIGPNGSGKTTTFSMLSGALRPSAGAITFNGERIEHLKANQCRGVSPGPSRIMPTRSRTSPRSRT